ncbi:MAG TPA: LysE family translocator [Xanthobacteraceae bacterium]|nr:LysE family translocator [Xanthobacteraceae bacterium]
MSLELFAAFILFAVVMLFTPGPNNIMLMTSGLNFGFSRTLPHMLGVSIGFGLMVFVVGIGLGAIFKIFPVLYAVLKYAGAAYLLYLACAIGTSRKVEEGRKKSRPLTFIEGAAFQWINAKGWIIALGAITTYAALTSFPLNVILLSAIFIVLGTASSATWAAFGSGLRGFLKAPSHVRAFNITMALLLVASLYPVFAEAWH